MTLDSADEIFEEDKIGFYLVCLSELKTHLCRFQSAVFHNTTL